MPTPTPNLGLAKPEVGDQAWDGAYYDAMDTLDAHPGVLAVTSEAERPNDPYEGQVISRLDLPGVLEQWSGGQWSQVNTNRPTSYVHYQQSPASTWTIPHNLGFYPNLSIEDSAGTNVEGDITHIDTNTVVVTFTAAFSGKAYLS